jgi:hypothetical protein
VSKKVTPASAAHDRLGVLLAERPGPPGAVAEAHHPERDAGTDVTIPPYGVRNRVERTGPAIRAALDPDRRAEFETDFRAALGHADDTLDLTAVTEVVDRWWARAVLTANPEVEAGALADQRRVEAGDPTVFATAMPSPQAGEGDRWPGTRSAG